jgi:hypothetical protein
MVGNRKLDPVTGKVPAVGNNYDVKNAIYTNSMGAVELKKLWMDPDFDSSLDAFYYVRVLQIPTPRWTTYDAKNWGCHRRVGYLPRSRSAPGPLPSGMPRQRKNRAAGKNAASQLPI